MSHRYYRKRYHLKPVPVVASIALVTVLIAAAVIYRYLPHGNGPSPAPLSSSTSKEAASSESASSGTETAIADKDVVAMKNQSGVEEKFKISEIPEGSPSDWNLILLNPDANNKIDKDLNIKMTRFDSQEIDSRAAGAYQKMCDAAKKAGITLYLRSGYRSMETQEKNYNNSVADYIAKGKTTAEAVTLTKQYYTEPGHSEHHTGLACDIITPQYHQQVYELDERFMKTDAYQWLVANSADYGFVLRYPQDKVAITKINFEPWHYRYVGVDHAKFMKKHNLCLEEYIELLKAAGR